MSNLVNQQRKSLMPSLAEVAWAAGLFEGEGCISMHCQLRKRVQSYKKFQASLSMTDQDIVERFAAIAGTGRVIVKNTPSMRAKGHKPQWMWQAYSGEAEKVLLMLLPFLGERRTARFNEVFLEVHSG